MATVQTVLLLVVVMVVVGHHRQAAVVVLGAAAAVVVAATVVAVVTVVEVHHHAALAGAAAAAAAMVVVSWKSTMQLLQLAVPLRREFTMWWCSGLVSSELRPCRSPAAVAATPTYGIASSAFVRSCA
jgi:hypothetical protein